jgi:hypothetical protein
MVEVGYGEDGESKGANGTIVITARPGRRKEKDMKAQLKRRSTITKLHDATSRRL